MDIKLPKKVLDLVRKSNDISQKMVPLHAEHAEQIMELNDKICSIDNEIGRCIRELIKTDGKTSNVGFLFAPSRFKK